MPLTAKKKKAVTKTLVDEGVCNAATAKEFLAAVGNIGSGGGARAGAEAGAGAAAASQNPNIDDSAPAWAPPADGSWEETKADGSKVPILTVASVEAFFRNVLKLGNRHINILRQEGVTHPADFGEFTAKEFDAVIKSVKGLGVPLPGMAQNMIKKTCDFFQYVNETGRALKDQYLMKEVIENHAILFKAIKDGFSSKEGSVGLPKLSKTTDVLACFD